MGRVRRGAEVMAPLIHRLRGPPSPEGEGLVRGGFAGVRRLDWVRAARAAEGVGPYDGMRMQMHMFAYQIQTQLQPKHSPTTAQIQTQKHPHTQKQIHPHSQKESGAGLLKVLKTLRFGVFAV